MSTVRTVRVATDAAYDVVLGHLGADAASLSDVLGRLLGETLGHRPERVAVVAADSAGAAPHADRVREAVAALGVRVLDLTVPDGEAGKTAEVAAECWERLGRAGFTRSDAVVSVGGGAVTDLGGFVAATWLRGVPVVHVPTTLLAMVDAAVGGKTGINTATGKNLVGSFHEPVGVVCDLDVLATLPRPELVAGLAEVIKCGFIADPEILAIVEADPMAALDPASPALAELAERAVAVKARVVAGDLRETSGGTGHPGREALNYGHTLAHAIERSESYAIRHGEAVAVGMIFAAELGRRAGTLDDATADRHADVLSSVGLPVRHAGRTFEELLDGMRVDKKARGAMLRFVVLDSLAAPRILAGPPDDALRAAYAVVAGESR